MKISHHARLLGIASSLLLLSASAQAVPISYTYTGSWSSFSAAPFGATYQATLTFDNGGATIANQNFGQADFVSGRVVSGTYDFTMLAADITSWQTNFLSDALGQLGSTASGWFNASNSGHSWHFDNDFADETFTDASGAQAGFFQTHTSNPGTFAAVPAPATLALLGLGLAGLGFSRRRQQAQ